MNMFRHPIRFLIREWEIQKALMRSCILEVFPGAGKCKSMHKNIKKEREGYGTAWLLLCRGEAKQYSHFARAFGIFTMKLSTGFPHNTATVLLALRVTVFENIYEHVNKLSCEISVFYF